MTAEPEKSDKLLADSENLGATDGADTPGSWSLVLQGDSLRVLDFPLCPAFHTIRLHCLPPFLFTSVSDILVFVNRC